MTKREADTLKIGDIISIKGILYESNTDIIGKIEQVFTHHFRILGGNGLYYSVQKLDCEYLTLLQRSNFSSYGEKQFAEDIERASQKM